MTQENGRSLPVLCRVLSQNHTTHHERRRQTRGADWPVTIVRVILRGVVTAPYKSLYRER